METRRFKPTSPTTIGEYTLDALAIEIDRGAANFRLELGKGYFIYWALPAARNDRLRLIFVDSAVHHVDEPEVVEDPFRCDVPKMEWSGVSFEASAGRYRCIVDDGDVHAELEWPPPRSPEQLRADELVRAVLAHPLDLDLRAVCADALIEAGDPRGELIELETKGGSRALRKRYLDRLKNAAPLVLGAAARRLSIDDVTLRQGFVERIVLPPAMPMEWWSEIGNAAELATVRAVDLRAVDWLTAHRILSAMPGSRLKALNELALARMPVPPLGPWFGERITCLSIDGVLNREMIEALAFFPLLSRVHVRWTARTDRLRDSDLLIAMLADKHKNLREVKVTVDRRVRGFVRAWLTELGRLDHVDKLTLLVGHEGWWLDRTGDRKWTLTPRPCGDDFDLALVRAIVAEIDGLDLTILPTDRSPSP